jgi:hypothetical protein
MYMKLKIGPTIELETCGTRESQSSVEINSSTWLYSSQESNPYLLS